MVQSFSDNRLDSDLLLCSDDTGLIASDTPALPSTAEELTDDPCRQDVPQADSHTTPRLDIIRARSYLLVAVRRFRCKASKPPNDDPRTASQIYHELSARVVLTPPRHETGLQTGEIGIARSGILGPAGVDRSCLISRYPIESLTVVSHLVRC